MKLYHGSPNKFESFNFDKMRSNATAEGVGAYFTNDINIARGYANNGGYLYTVDVETTTAMSADDLTVSRNQLIKIIKTMELDEYTEIVSNFGDESSEPKARIIKRAADELIENNLNDVDLLAELYNLTGGEAKTLDIFSSVTGMTYVEPVAEWGGDQKIIVVIDPKTITIEKIEACQD